MKATPYQRTVTYGAAIVKKPYPGRIDLDGELTEILSSGLTMEKEIYYIKKLIHNGYRRRRK